MRLVIIDSALKHGYSWEEIELIRQDILAGKMLQATPEDHAKAKVAALNSLIESYSNSLRELKAQKKLLDKQDKIKSQSSSDHQPKEFSHQLANA